jgi:hypothetical protein
LPSPLPTIFLNKTQACQGLSHGQDHKPYIQAAATEKEKRRALAHFDYEMRSARRNENQETSERDMPLALRSFYLGGNPPDGGSCGSGGGGAEVMEDVPAPGGGTRVSEPPLTESHSIALSSRLVSRLLFIAMPFLLEV